MQSVVGKGIYELPEAARLIRVPVRQLRQLVRPSGSDGSSILQLDYEKDGGRVVFSFLDMIESYMIGRMLERGIPHREIRAAHRKLSLIFGDPRPFARQELATDGKSVFLLFEENERHHVEDVVRSQFVMEQVVERFLERIEYNKNTQLAERWRWNDRVILDPTRRFGAPMIETAGITTETLATAYYANREDASIVARWWRVSVDEVIAAVEFERALGQRAAA